MKTPRDLLLARHQAATPKLDAIRRSVVAELNHQATQEQGAPASLVTLLLGCLNQLWRELIWPCRRTWAGLAAVWVLLLIVNVAQHDGAQPIMAKSAPSTAMLLTFRDQQKLLNDLFADRSLTPDADQPRIFLPKPRTEAGELTTV